MKILSSPSRTGSLFSSGTTWLKAGAFLAVAALFIGACGGDDGDSSAAPTATTASDSSAPTGSTGAAGATGPAVSTGGGTGSAAGGGGTITAGDLADVTDLQSFRWDITLSGAGSFLAGAGVPSVPGASDGDFTASGAYIAPDQAQVSINAGGLEFKQTIKGDQQWTTIAGTTTGPIPTTDDAASLIYVTSFVDPESSFAGESVNCGGTENVNGVSAVRCETTDAINQQIAAGFAGQGVQTTDASYIMWVAQDGNYVVKWQFDATGTSNGEPFEWSFVSNITDVNNVSSIDP